MKTGMNRKMAAMVPVAMLLAVACGMPEDDVNDDELGVAQEYARAKPAPVAVYALKTTDVKVSGKVPVNKTSFVIASTLNVYFAIDYTNVTGTHSQSVQVFAPDGSFYQKFDRQVCIGSACTVNKPEVIGTVAQYWETLPVSGSYISQYNLAGGWRADLYVDGVKKTGASFLMQ